jgi:hypothetical protein
LVVWWLVGLRVFFIPSNLVIPPPRDQVRQREGVLSSSLDRQPPTAHRPPPPPTAHRPPPTADRRPPTANRQPPTANRPPPTALCSSFPQFSTFWLLASLLIPQVSAISQGKKQISVGSALKSQPSGFRSSPIPRPSAPPSGLRSPVSGLPLPPSSPLDRQSGQTDFLP